MRKEEIIDAHLRAAGGPGPAARPAWGGAAADGEWEAVRTDLDVADDWPVLGEAADPQAAVDEDEWDLLDSAPVEVVRQYASESEEGEEEGASAPTLADFMRVRPARRSKKEVEKPADWLSAQRSSSSASAVPRRPGGGVFRVTETRSAPVGATALKDPLQHLSNAGVFNVLSMLPPGAQATVASTNSDWHAKIARQRVWGDELQQQSRLTTPAKRCVSADVEYMMGEPEPEGQGQGQGHDARFTLQANPSPELKMRCAITSHNLLSGARKSLIYSELEFSPAEMAHVRHTSRLPGPAGQQLCGIPIVELLSPPSPRAVGYALDRKGLLFRFQKGFPVCPQESQSHVETEGHSVLKLSPSQELVATAAASAIAGPSVTVWRNKRVGGPPQRVVNFSVPRNYGVRELAFLGNRQLVVRDTHGGVHLFDIESGEQLPLDMPHDCGAATSMALHKRMIVCGTSNGRVVVLDPQNQRPAVVSRVVGEVVCSISAIAADKTGEGSLFALGSDGGVRPYSRVKVSRPGLSAQPAWRTPLKSSNRASCIKAAHGHLFMSAPSGEVFDYDIQRVHELGEWQVTRIFSPIEALSQLPIQFLAVDETKLVAGSRDRLVFYDWASGRQRSHTRLHQEMTSLTLAGSLLAVGTVAGGVLLDTTEASRLGGPDAAFFNKINEANNHARQAHQGVVSGRSMAALRRQRDEFAASEAQRLRELEEAEEKRRKDKGGEIKRRQDAKKQLQRSRQAKSKAATKSIRRERG